MRPLAQLLSDLHHEQTHRAGLVSFETIDAIDRICSGQIINWSMETGCGLTTVALSNLSKRHVVFAYDDREHESSSVAFAVGSPAYRSDVCSHIFGPTQVTIPAYRFEEPIDFALIDGPHGFPFPQLEYFHIFPHLRLNALLAIDDINIPHIWSMFACLAEDDMYELVDIIDGKTGFLRRTAAPAVSPIGDDWYLQRHNFMRWPMKVVPDTVWQMGDAIDFTPGGNRAAFALLGWSQAEEWGAWSDGSEATISFRWPGTLKPPVFVNLEFLYGARADITLLINGRTAGVLPGFAEHDMRWHTVGIQLFEEDTARTSLLTFKPTATWEIDAFPNKRQLGIALNQIRYISTRRPSDTIR
jgi:hypothetical protein